MEASNIAEELDKIQFHLAKMRKCVLGLRNIDSKLNDIAAGALPSSITADEEAALAGDAEMSDEGFIRALAEIATGDDGIRRMMNCATLAARLIVAKDRIEARSAKLAERIRSTSKGAPERANAIGLKSRTDDAAKVIAARIAKTLDKFFEARLWTLNATAKMTERMMGLFKDGSEAMRDAALANCARDAISALGEMEQRAVRGRMTVTTTGKKRVTI